MKKLLLFGLILFSVVAKSQSDINTVLINDGSYSANGRCPRATSVATRSVWLVNATEMAAAGFVLGDVITSLGFNQLDPPNSATTGSFVVYLENVPATVVANAKNSVWATAISTMTTVSNGSITVPATPGTFDSNFTGGTAFIYTGGSLYIAFDYQNLAGTLATVANTALCETSMASGIKSAFAAAGVTTPPANLAATFSAFRPETRLGKSVLCAKPADIKEDLAAKTSTSVKLSWTSTTSTTLEFGIKGFALGTGTTAVGITSPYVVSGLNPSIIYDFVLSNNCGTVILPVLSAIDGIRTNTVFTPANTPYNTSFEEDSFTFEGWSAPAGTPVGSNFQLVNFGAGALVQNGVSSIYSLSGVTTADANNWVLSRGVNLNTNPATVTLQERNYVDAGNPAGPAPSIGTSSYNIKAGTSQTIAAQSLTIGSETGLSNTAYALKTYTFTPPAAGVYYFGIQNVSPANTAGRQGLLMDNFTVTQTPLATDNFLSNVFLISPNPANDIVKISNLENINVQIITITDVNGRFVKNLNYKNVSNVEINVSDLTAGLYFLNINSDNGNITKKIMKN